MRTLVTRLRAAVVEGRVTPRDASIWSAATGVDALSATRAQIAARHGIGVRQVANVVAAVDQILRAATALEPGPHAGGDDDPLPLVAAEIDLSDHPYADDGAQAVEVLRLRREGLPIRRDGGAVPRPTSTRVRRHRMRKSIDDRVGLLRRDPHLSVAQPYLVTPWTLPASLIESVPPRQRRRGKPPHEDWLVQVAGDMRRSYETKDGRARDLARVVLWGFSRFAQSPFPDIEAGALRQAATIAREQGALSSYWIYRRVRFLVGDRHLESLLLTSDAAITLRNHGYPGEADRLLKTAMSAVALADVSDEAKLLTRWHVLDQLAFNHSRAPRTPGSLGAAARYSDELLACGERLGHSLFTGAALRRRFGVEFARAALRATTNHERFWIHPRGWDAFAAADASSSARSEEPIFRAQWNLERMRVGLALRSVEEIVDSGNRFLSVLEEHPWIRGDHPNESHGYGLHRARAITRYPQIRGLLPPLVSGTGMASPGGADGAGDTGPIAPPRSRPPGQCQSVWLRRTSDTGS